MGHVRAIEQPDSPSYGKVGRYHFKAGVKLALSEKDRDEALVDKAEGDLSESRPVELLKLLRAHVSVVSLVQGPEYTGRRVDGGVPEHPLDYEGSQPLARGQYLLRTTVQIQRHLLGATKQIGQQVEGRLTHESVVRGKTEALELL